MRCILLPIEGDAARHVSTSNYREFDESQLPQAPHLFEAKQRYAFFLKQPSFARFLYAIIMPRYLQQRHYN